MLRAGFAGPGNSELTSVSSPQDEEAHLLRRCRAGDSAAWDELFDLHYPATGRFIFQLGSDLTREDTEEICQEVFLAAIRNIEQFHGRSRFQTWLFRIAANKARDFREKKHAAKRGGNQVPLSLQFDETGQEMSLPSPGPHPDQSLMQSERRKEVEASLEKLELPCREIIQLRYFAELSYEEIAAALKLNPKTVSSRLSKCLDHLEVFLRKIFSREKAEVFPSNQ